MPALTPAEKARYRTTPHASQKYLYVFVPTVIFAAEVNNAPAPGAVNIDYDTVTVGAYTVIEGGETLLVGSSAGGSDIGRLRVRGATAGHLIVAWDSDILWSNNQHLTVLREFLPWRRQQRTVAGVVTKDYDVSWTDQTTKWPPAPLMGDATIKLFRPGDPSAQLYIADRGSYPMAPGATITAHAWVMPGGTPATSASSTPGLVTVSAPIKDYWKLSITDSNDKVSSGRRPIVVVDPANCYTEFVCESLEDNIDGGVVARFRVFGDAPVSAFPPRASIFYFTEDYYGNGHGEHIKFFGYIVERSVKKDPETSDVTFTAVSCVSIADKLVVSASELQDVVTPSSWQQAKSLTVRRSLFYLIYFHSTLFQVADVDIVDDPTPDWYVVFPEGTLWGLMNTFARTWRALRCGVTKRGRVVIGVDPQMRAVADRGVVTEVMQLQHGDWHGEIDPVITDFPPHAFLDVNGDYYDGVPGVSKELPVLSIAPGHPDKEFGGKDAFSGMVSNGQLESNQFAGLMLGQKNNPYSPFKIELVGNWWEAFEPAFQEYLVAPAGGWPTNAFPALLDSARLIVRGMSQSDAPDGVQLTTLLVEPESFPEQAVDGDYPPPFTPPCDDCEIPCVGCDPPAPVPPTVDFGGDPLSGCVPFTVTFTPTIGGGTATGYLWDFGDGSFSTLAAPTHSYTVPGTYTVSLGVDFLEADYVEATKAAYITATACEPQSDTWGMLVTARKGFYYTNDISAASPLWVQDNRSLPTTGGAGVWEYDSLIYDPLAPTTRQFAKTAINGKDIYKRTNGVGWTHVQDARDWIAQFWPTYTFTYAAPAFISNAPPVGGVDALGRDLRTVDSYTFNYFRIDGTYTVPLVWQIVAHPTIAGWYSVIWTLQGYVNFTAHTTRSGGSPQDFTFDEQINLLLFCYTDDYFATIKGFGGVPSVIDTYFVENFYRSLDYIYGPGSNIYELDFRGWPGGGGGNSTFHHGKRFGGAHWAYPIMGKHKATGSPQANGDVIYVTSGNINRYASTEASDEVGGDMQQGQSHLCMSADKGATWSVVQDHGESHYYTLSPFYRHLVVDPSNQDVVFELNGGTGYEGVWRSTNRGVAFSQLSPAFSPGVDAAANALRLSLSSHGFTPYPAANGVATSTWYAFGGYGSYSNGTVDHTHRLYTFTWNGVSLTVSYITVSGLPVTDSSFPIHYGLIIKPGGSVWYAIASALNYVDGAPGENFSIDPLGATALVYQSSDQGVTWTPLNTTVDIPLTAKGIHQIVLASSAAALFS